MLMEHRKEAIKNQFIRQLRSFCCELSEKALAEAYELGRVAVEEGIGELEILSYYQEALLQLNSGSNEEQKQPVNLCMDFLSECFAPYEMRQRGFRDLIQQLKDQNEQLQDEIKRRESLHERLQTAHENLKKSRSQLITAHQIARLGNWEWDILEDELYWSDELCRIYGKAADEYPRSYREFLHCLPDKDQEQVNVIVMDALRKREGFELEHSFIHPDGTARVLHCRGEAIVDGQGELLKMIGTGQDITKLKEVENKLRVYSEQLRSLSAKQDRIREEERIRIAREIHDELGQMLTVLKIDISMIMKRVGKKGETEPVRELKNGMKELVDRIDTIIQSVQRITAELRPEVLDDLGLREAIEWQAAEFEKRTGINFNLSVKTDSMEQLDEHRSTAIFRIFQETLTNILRHAEATRVDIELKQEEPFIILEVSDDGKGISKRKIEHSDSLGIIGMRERSHFLGGDITFSGEKGTTVTLKLPLHES